MTTTTPHAWLTERIETRRAEIAKTVAAERAYIAMPALPAEAIALSGLRMVALETEDREIGELALIAQHTPSANELAAAIGSRMASLFGRVAGQAEAKDLRGLVSDLAAMLRELVKR